MVNLFDPVHPSNCNKYDTRVRHADGRLVSQLKKPRPWPCRKIRTRSGRYCSSKALLMTLTELIAIAAPAITGESHPKAASGMPRRL
jgi:hypothetical protein